MLNFKTSKCGKKSPHMANALKNGSLQVTLWESYHTNLSTVKVIYLAKTGLIHRKMYNIEGEFNGSIIPFWGVHQSHLW